MGRIRRYSLVALRLAVALVILGMIAAGFWMLNQVLDAVTILGRSTVNSPLIAGPVDVWTYHDAAYTLLWVAYVGLVVWEFRPWRPGSLAIGRLLIALLGFSLLTAGLWISQDIMNAVLVLHRTSVDLPFFVDKVDLFQARDLATLLSSFSFVTFYLLMRVSKAD